MKGKKKKVWVITSSLTVIAAVLLIWFYVTQTVWVESEPYQRESKDQANTLVVVYSRTGNTIIAAKEAARHFDADLLIIEAPLYTRDLKGLKRASDDAGEQVISTPIEHTPVNLEEYDLIILCSPTWWFRPAVPLWSFVENHDFKRKHVFLIMTGNSRYKEHLIRDFKNHVEKKNGIYLDMLFIKRGRIYWQKTPDQVNKEVREAINERKEMWRTAGR